MINGVALYLTAIKTFLKETLLVSNSMKTIIERMNIETIKTYRRMIVLLSRKTVVAKEMAKANKMRINAQFWRRYSLNILYKYYRTDSGKKVLNRSQKEKGPFLFSGPERKETEISPLG